MAGRRSHAAIKRVWFSKSCKNVGFDGAEALFPINMLHKEMLCISFTSLVFYSETCLKKGQFHFHYITAHSPEPILIVVVFVLMSTAQ